MQFLDAIGLAYFWEKIKNWVNINYLSLTGGTINGDVNISGNVSALQFKKTNGTSTQVLIADGSVREIGSANGIAGLDSNGYVPLAQLGNLDTTVAEVVTALPTTNIKKHIYLVKDASGVTQNQYEEYLYTGDTSAAYDASKWEKLGDFRATVDLADYAKKSETVEFSTIRLEKESLNEAPQIQQQVIRFENFNGDIKDVVIKDAESNMAGFMSVRDKNKLDWFDRSNINIRSLDVGKLLTAQSPIPIMVTYYEDKLVYTLSALNNEFSPSFTIPAVSERAGLMSVNDKSKLDGIASGATADSAITTAEIDALFA